MKTIDLGALQDAHMKAKATLTLAKAQQLAATRKVELAIAAADRARTKTAEATSGVEQAKVAMLEGARTVSNA